MARTQIYCLRFVQYVIVMEKKTPQKQKHDDCCMVYWVTVMDDENMC